MLFRSSDPVLSGLLSTMQAISTGSSGTVSSSGSGLQFLPYLTDISNWAKVFSGGNATLFTYEMPKLEFQFGFDVLLATIPIPFPPLAWLGIGIGAVGSASGYVDLSFCYDTFGVQKAISSGNPFDALDGFYINDWTLPAFKNGQVVPGTGGVEKQIGRAHV